MSKPVLAIFDLDYTLTKRGTWGRLVWFSVRKRPHLWLPLLFSTAAFQLRYKLGKVPRGDVKKNMMQWGMTGKSRRKMEAMAEKFCANEVSNGLRPGAIKALGRHKANEDYILIASAAVDLVVKPISKKLGVDGYVCTLLDWGEKDYLKSDFASENCYGEAKLVAVKDYIARHKLEALGTIFYSDSVADLPVLEFADKAITVDPDARLEAVAREQGFEIQNWM